MRIKQFLIRLFASKTAVRESQTRCGVLRRVRGLDRTAVFVQPKLTAYRRQTQLGNRPRGSK